MLFEAGRHSYLGGFVEIIAELVLFTKVSWILMIGSLREPFSW